MRGNVKGEMSSGNVRIPKKKCTSLFGHYRTVGEHLPSSGLDEPAQQRRNYIAVINSSIFDATAESSRIVYLCAEFADLKPLFARLFCVPTSSAPVQRVFSQQIDNVI